jgi:hypothetical protein
MQQCSTVHPTIKILTWFQTRCQNKFRSYWNASERLTQHTHFYYLLTKINMFKVIMKKISKEMFISLWYKGPLIYQEKVPKLICTYEDWNVCVSSCFSSPRWLIVKIRKIGMPTARYAHASCKKITMDCTCTLWSNTRNRILIYLYQK